MESKQENVHSHLDINWPSVELKVGRILTSLACICMLVWSVLTQENGNTGTKEKTLTSSPEWSQ